MNKVAKNRIIKVLPSGNLSEYNHVRDQWQRIPRHMAKNLMSPHRRPKLKVTFVKECETPSDLIP